jgi:hypothetical protein
MIGSSFIIIARTFIVLIAVAPTIMNGDTEALDGKIHHKLNQID